MEKLTDALNLRQESEAADELEQVRQLLLGNVPSQQDRRIEALERRVGQLEQLLQALVAHGESSRQNWENEVTSILDGLAPEPGEREVSRDVTPLVPRRGNNV